MYNKHWNYAWNCSYSCKVYLINLYHASHSYLGYSYTFSMTVYYYGIHFSHTMSLSINLRLCRHAWHDAQYICWIAIVVNSPVSTDILHGIYIVMWSFYCLVLLGYLFCQQHQDPKSISSCVWIFSCEHFSSFSHVWKQVPLFSYSQISSHFCHDHPSYFLFLNLLQISYVGRKK